MLPAPSVLPPHAVPLPRKTLLASAGAGFVLGAAIWRGPIYSLEIAQVAAGVVALPTLHPIYAHHTSVLSPFLVQIPAWLLRAGVPEPVLCVLLSGLVACLSFSAVSVCAWAWSRDRIFALAAPCFLLAFDFAGHKYPIFFPAGEHDAGIAGFFAALLALGLASLGPSRAGALALGLLPAVHPTLALVAWIGCGAALALRPAAVRRAWIALWRWFALGAAALILGVALRAALAMPPATFLPASAEDIDALLSSIMLRFDYHRLPIGLLREPWRMLVFFEVELYWIGFLCAVRWSGRAAEPAKFLMDASLAWTAVAVPLTLLDEVAPELSPLPVKALMAARWLNLNTPLWALAVLGSLAALSRQQARGAACGVLALLTGAIGFGFVSRPTALAANWRGVAEQLSWNVGGLAFPAAAIATLALLLWSGRGAGRWRAARSVAALTLILTALMTLGRVTYAREPSSWSADGILRTEWDRTVFDAARAGHGLLLVPPWTVPWAKLKTRRGLVLDVELVDVLPYASRAAPAFEHVLRDIYGASLLSPLGWKQLLSRPAGWDTRTSREWSQIGHRYQATQVLVSPRVRLALPEEARSPNLVLYRIPQPEGSP